ncbi:MAG TPA: ribonuclease D [Actinomycetes bacterium]|nr:ribonuclease D [Actinomycetes bacterium]
MTVPEQTTAPGETASDAPIPLLEPREGLPDVTASPEGLQAAASALASGSGPIAVDAERASGYRYGHRAYLIQIRREGAGTVLVDPIGFHDLSVLAEPLREAEWVLHAASQDLPCLADLGLTPSTLFDTELAGRLLGYPRVGLGAMCESVLGLALEKGHAAVDWSTRPLPEAWLRYAALDVEVLIELRDALAAELEASGKLEWARQEFAAVAAAPPAPPRVDPWRRTSGMHRVRKARQLAVVRELWLARDEVARSRDTSPGRVLPDSAIVEAALRMPETQDELVSLPVFGGRANKRQASRWFGAIERARNCPDSQLPSTTLVSDAPPPARSWGDKNPEAAARLAVLRPAVAAIADEHGLPTENLLAPDTVRRVAWDPPADASPDVVAKRLASHGARPWQIELTARPIAKALDRVRREAETS